jgi:hypothetical protein
MVAVRGVDAEPKKDRDCSRPFRSCTFYNCGVELVHGDGAAGARVNAGPTLGAVVGPIQACDILEVVAAARALIDADAASGAEVRINNRQGHGSILSRGHTLFSRSRDSNPAAGMPQSTPCNPPWRLPPLARGQSVSETTRGFRPRDPAELPRTWPRRDRSRVR